MDRKTPSPKQITATPTGLCWCGCGESTPSFWVQNHDATAYGKLISLYESAPKAGDGLANLLASLGFDSTTDGSIGAAAHHVEVMKHLDKVVPPPRKKRRKKSP